MEFTTLAYALSMIRERTLTTRCTERGFARSVGAFGDFNVGFAFIVLFQPRL